jgi:hypothetical protein
MEFRVIDATLAGEEQQRCIRQTVVDCLGEVLRTGVLRSVLRGGHGTATAAAVL